MNILHLIHNLNRDGAQMVIYYLTMWNKNAIKRQVAATTIRHGKPNWTDSKGRPPEGLRAGMPKIKRSYRSSGQTENSSQKKKLLRCNSINSHIVCAWKRGGPLRDDLEKNSVPVFIPEDNLHGLKTIRRVMSYLDSIIESQKIDVIHAHMADGAFWGSIASVRRSIPMLITHHSNKLVPQTPVYFKLLSRVLLLFTARFAKVNVAVSELVKEILKRQLHLKEENISVVENGVPMPKDFDEHWVQKELKSRKGMQFHTDGPSIISVGRLVDIKGQSQLIDAAPKILQHFPNARFTFIGSGPLKSALEQRAKNLNISDSVTFPGITHDIPSFLRKSDLYVSTSHSEGIPLATLEAMAWRVPVVASDVIGNRDVVENEVTGLLYPIRKIDRLSLCILRLLDNPALANSLAIKAEQFVNSRFSLKQMALQYDSIYSQIAKPI